MHIYAYKTDYSCSCIHVCIYVYLYVHIYVCTYMHITQTFSSISTPFMQLHTCNIHTCSTQMQHTPLNSCSYIHATCIHATCIHATYIHATHRYPPPSTHTDTHKHTQTHRRLNLSSNGFAFIRLSNHLIIFKICLSMTFFTFSIT